MIEQTQHGGRLDRLLPLLEADPGNGALLADAAETALAEGRADIASDLLERHGRLTELSAAQINLAGLAAMQLQQFEKAAELFGTLMGDGEADPAVRFNLAWCRAMQKDVEGALELLEGQLCASLPQAAMLRVQLLHGRGDLDPALDLARSAVDRFPDYQPLLAAVSVLAIDMEDEALAERCAAGAPDHPDAMTTLGTLALGRDEPKAARDLFDAAVARNPGGARGWIGRGLAELMAGDAAKAAEDLDRGAGMFGDHIGSWIAAGWAHFVRKDLPASRERFERAVELDPNFAESQGALAVLDLLDGNMDEARRRAETARRLDRNCYSAALAQALIAAGAGRPEEARRIVEIAINAPVDASGRTIAQSLARLGMGLGSQS